MEPLATWLSSRTPKKGTSRNHFRRKRVKVALKDRLHPNASFCRRSRKLPRYCSNRCSHSRKRPLKAISITRIWWSRKSKWSILVHHSSRIFHSAAESQRVTAAGRTTLSLMKSWWASLPRKWFQTGSVQTIRHLMVTITTTMEWSAIYHRIRVVASPGTSTKILLSRTVDHRRAFRRAILQQLRAICPKKQRIGRSEWMKASRI